MSDGRRYAQPSTSRRRILLAVDRRAHGRREIVREALPRQIVYASFSHPAFFLSQVEPNLKATAIAGGASMTYAFSRQSGDNCSSDRMPLRYVRRLKLGEDPAFVDWQLPREKVKKTPRMPKSPPRVSARSPGARVCGLCACKRSVIRHRRGVLSLARQARDPVPNLSVKNVRVAVLRASD